MELINIREIVLGDADVVVLFEDGRRALLRKSHDEYDYYLQLLRRSIDRKSPLGIVLSRSEVIVEIGSSKSDIVKDLWSSNEVTKVVFELHDGIFLIEQRNPKFRYIVDLFEKSIRNREEVWFVALSPGLAIADARPYEGLPQREVH